MFVIKFDSAAKAEWSGGGVDGEVPLLPILGGVDVKVGPVFRV